MSQESATKKPKSPQAIALREYNALMLDYRNFTQQQLAELRKTNTPPSSQLSKRK